MTSFDLCLVRADNGMPHIGDNRKDIMATTVMDIDARIEEHMSQIDRLKTRRKALAAKERERAEQAAAWADAKREECFETARKLRLCTFEADDRKNPKVSMAGERYADTFAKNDPYDLLL